MKTNTKYEILTPDGFKNFTGVQKLNKQTIELLFDNNLVFRGSFNHQIYDYDGNPIILSKIEIGDKIKSHDGFLIVKNIKKHYNKTSVYDLINVDGGNVYYTNNILSHNCEFAGSGDNVVDSEAIHRQQSTNVIDPILKDREWNNDLWIWALPVKGHRYILAVDVSRGDSEDATSMCIIDYDTFEQVLEYRGKIPPDTAALMVDHYGRMYNALSTFDITGGMGIACTSKLKEIGYPKKLLHYDNINDTEMFFIPSDDSIPGINFASKNRRSQIVAGLEEAISRGGFKIRSIRLINELNTFIYKNGRPDHARGSHDDCVMSLGMCIFVGNTSFKKLHESDNLVKAMLDSWKIVDNVQASSNRELKDVISSNPEKDKIYQRENDMILENTRNYNWLFTKPR